MSCIEYKGKIYKSEEFAKMVRENPSKFVKEGNISVDDIYNVIDDGDNDRTIAELGEDVVQYQRVPRNTKKIDIEKERDNIKYAKAIVDKVDKLISGIKDNKFNTRAKRFKVFHSIENYLEVYREFAPDNVKKLYYKKGKFEGDMFSLRDEMQEFLDEKGVLSDKQKKENIKKEIEERKEQQAQEYKEREEKKKQEQEQKKKEQENEQENEQEEVKTEQKEEAIPQQKEEETTQESEGTTEQEEQAKQEDKKNTDKVEEKEAKKKVGKSSVMNRVTANFKGKSIEEIREIIRNINADYDVQGHEDTMQKANEILEFFGNSIEDTLDAVEYFKSDPEKTLSDSVKVAILFELQHRLRYRLSQMIDINKLSGENTEGEEKRESIERALGDVISQISESGIEKGRAISFFNYAYAKYQDEFSAEYIEKNLKHKFSERMGDIEYAREQIAMNRDNNLLTKLQVAYAERGLKKMQKMYDELFGDGELNKSSITELGRQIKEVDRRISEAMKELSKENDEESIRIIKGDLTGDRRGNTKEGDSALKKTGKAFKDASNKIGEFNIKDENTLSLDIGKGLYNFAVNALKDTFQATGNIAESLDVTMRKFKNRPEAKKLSKEEKEKFEKEFRDKVISDFDRYNIVINEDYNKSFPYSDVLDIVENGEENLNNIVKHIKDNHFFEDDHITESVIKDNLNRFLEKRRLTKEEINDELARQKGMGELISDGLKDKLTNPQKKVLKKAVKNTMVDATKEERDKDNKNWEEALDKSVKHLEIKANEIEEELKKRAEEALDKSVEHIDVEEINTNEELEKRKKEALKKYVDDYNEIRERALKRVEKDKNAKKEFNKEELKEIKSAKKELKLLEKKYEDLLKRVADAQDKLRAVKDAIKEAKAKKPLTYEQKVRNAEKRIEREIERLTDIIKYGEPNVRGVPERVESNRLSELKAERDHLRGILKEMNKNSEEAERKRLENRKNGIKRSIQQLKERLATGDYWANKRETLPVDEEILELQREKESLRYELMGQKMKAEEVLKPTYKKVLDWILDVWHLPRMVLATGEFSVMSVQLARTALRHPIASFKSFVKGFAAFMSSKYYKDVEMAIRNRPDYAVMVNAGLGLTIVEGDASLREELIGNNLINRLIILGKASNKPNVNKIAKTAGKLNFTEAFERMTSFIGNAMRLHMWDMQVAELEKMGMTYNKNPEVYKTTASMINTYTGRANIPSGLKAVQPYLGFMFFSPRLMGSVFNQVFFYHWVKGAVSVEGKALHPAQKEAMKTDLITFALAGLMFALGSYGLKDDRDKNGDDIISIDTDPRSSFFMNIRVQGANGKATYYNPLGGSSIPIYRLIARLVTGERVKRVEGTNNFVVDKLGGFGKPTRWQEILRTLFYNKMHPSMSMFYRYLDSDKDGKYYGQTFEEREFFMPIFWKTMIDFQKTEPTYFSNAITATAGALGVGINIIDSKSGKAGTGGVTISEKSQEAIIEKLSKIKNLEFENYVNEDTGNDVSVFGVKRRTLKNKKFRAELNNYASSDNELKSLERRLFLRHAFYHPEEHSENAQKLMKGVRDRINYISTRTGMSNKEATDGMLRVLGSTSGESAGSALYEFYPDFLKEKFNDKVKILRVLSLNNDGRAVSIYKAYLKDYIKDKENHSDAEMKKANDEKTYYDLKGKGGEIPDSDNANGRYSEENKKLYYRVKRSHDRNE